MRPNYLPRSAPSQPLWFLLSALFAVLAAFMFVSASDWDAAIEDDRMYCQAVYTQQIGDWRMEYAKMCAYGDLKPEVERSLRASRP